ncbi:glycosyl hydrolase-related protein [Parabacteroides sp. OttesenSCG-928-N08]|nr:glycosyl hydrolase-related protein [Parabacteroides sp. OttesenSCG-928-N08]
MRHYLFLFALLFSTLSAWSQNPLVDIEYDKPYQYEKRNGRLEVLATIPLETKAKESVKVMLDNQPVDIASSTKEHIQVWLPLVGETQHLQVTLGRHKTPIVSQLYSPLIPKEWGYFQNGTIHIISSSHQDIAWMNTPDSCRYDRIYHIINPALEMMKNDPDFAFGMEQTLNLMEFLEEFPHRKEEVIQRYKEGRFAWGATYNQPYEGLESGEQLIRQSYYGRKWIKENLPGCDDVTAYNIDVPGRTWQMPQILAKSGIENLFISRMREGLYDWYSPDGSKVFTFTPGNYGWAVIVWRFLEEDAISAFGGLHHRSQLWSDYFRSRNIPPHYAVVISNDSEEPANYKPLVDEWNRIVALSEVPLPQIKHSTAESYFSTVNVPEATMEEVSGERPDLWLYIHGPAHYQAIRAKREAGVLLPAAEMFTTINCLLDGDLSSYPKKTFDSAWMASIYPDHGWGGKNGEITDSIFRESLEAARDSGKELLDNALRAITEKVETGKEAIVVFNDLNWERTDIVSISIAMDEKSAQRIVIKDSDGRQVPVQVKREKAGYRVMFPAENIPSLGYKSYYLHRGKANHQPPTSVKQYSNYYENEYYKVTLGDGGIAALFDKELNRELLNCTKFKGGDVLNVGYTGNGAGEFTQTTPPTPGDLSAISGYKALWKIVENGPLFATYENIQDMKNTDVVQRIRIYHTMKKIDFDITLTDFDGTHNRQFRLALPLNMQEATINYEVPMGVLEVGKDEMQTIPGGWAWGGTYRQPPKDIHPREIQNFISANGEGYGVTLSSCVAVADWIDPSRESVDYPILQGILLSSHKSCHGLGNWYEQKGAHQYTFSLLSHQEGWQNGYRFGVEANHPLLAVRKEHATKGTLPSEMSFLTTSEPFVHLSTIKKCDTGDDVIVRLTEMQGRDVEVKITTPLPVRQVIQTNLIEEEQKEIKETGRSITLPVGHHAIETFKIRF